MNTHFGRRVVPIFVFLSVFVTAWGLSRAAALRAEAAPGRPAGAVTVGQIEVGIGGRYKVGRWTPVSVEVNVGRPLEARLVLRSADPDGNPAEFPSSAVELAPGRNIVRGLFQAGRIDAPLHVEIRQGTERLATRTLRFAEKSQQALPLSSQLIAILGEPAGLPQPPAEADGERSGTAFQVVRLDGPERLPGDPGGLAALDVLLLAGEYQLDESRSQAVRDWVRQGGHLVIAAGSTAEDYRDSPLAEWVPVPVTGQSRLRELSGLESFSGKSARVPIGGFVQAARLGPVEGRRIVSELDGPVLVRVAYGFGRVTFLALDLDRPPLSNWEPLSDVVRKILADPRDTSTAKQSSRLGQLAHSGITDLASQLHAAQDHFPQIARFSNWTVMGLILVYLLLIGPVDYLLVHRILKRPHLTWATFPVMVAAAALLAVWTAQTGNGGRVHVNQLDVLDIDADSQLARSRTWTTIYSPATRRYSVSVEPLDVGSQDGERPAPLLSWNGIPESSFGGMYRQMGFDLARPEYRFGEGLSSVEDLPIPIWSTKTLAASWQGQTGPLVESRLESPSPGTLSGSFVHRLPVPIEDWIVAYENRVYRPRPRGLTDRPAAIPPHQPWSPTGPNIDPRDLSGHLTRAVARRVQREQGRGEEILTERSPYDPLDRRPEEIVRMITFHQAAGGKSYTGLDNAALRDLEFSEFLFLNRAVLFGRIDAKAAGLRLDGTQSVEPDRHETWVRIILPVEQTGTPGRPTQIWVKPDR